MAAAKHATATMASPMTIGALAELGAASAALAPISAARAEAPTIAAATDDQASTHARSTRRVQAIAAPATATAPAATAVTSQARWAPQPHAPMAEAHAAATDNAPPTCRAIRAAPVALVANPVRAAASTRNAAASHRPPACAAPARTSAAPSVPRPSAGPGVLRRRQATARVSTPTSAVTGAARNAGRGGQGRHRHEPCRDQQWDVPPAPPLSDL